MEAKILSSQSDSLVHLQFQIYISVDLHSVIHHIHSQSDNTESYNVLLLVFKMYFKPSMQVHMAGMNLNCECCQTLEIFSPITGTCSHKCYSCGRHNCKSHENDLGHFTFNISHKFIWISCSHLSLVQ